MTAVTASMILVAIRQAYPAAAIVREVSMDDPTEQAIYRKHLLDGEYGECHRRWIEKKNLEVATSIPEGWTPGSSIHVRRIDALMRDATGYTAIEIKISRGDFKRDTEEKRRAWRDHTRRFIYAAPAGLLNVTEIPEGCGLWEYSDGNIRVVKRAKINKDPLELPRSVFDTMLYRVSNYEKSAA